MVLSACYVDPRLPAPGRPKAYGPGLEPALARNLRVIEDLFPDLYCVPSESLCIEHADSYAESASPLVLFIDGPIDSMLVTLQQRQYPPTILPVALVANEDSEMTRLVNLGAVDVIDRAVQSARLRGVVAHIHRTTAAAAAAATESDTTVRPQPQTYAANWIGGPTTRTRGVIEEERLIDFLFHEMFFDLAHADMANADADKSADKSEESACEKAKNSYLRSLIGTWDFPAHRLTDDDLAQCAFLIFEHAFTMPEVESLVLTRHQLKRFLIVLRRSYQPINPYHNFRHVVDVLQATFYFLLCMHAIPPLPPSASFPSPPSSASPTAPSSTPTSFASSSESSPAPQKSLSVLLTPIDALALLVTAIGHDVGHPGVTNSFLISARSPLARIYSDRSVLESFHCAAFSQILHRYWPAVLQQLEIKGIMVESVLATDMAMHNEYMQKITAVVKAISEGGDVVVEGDGGYRKRLLCASLIKCADISNVARIMDISTHWGTVLTEEFKNMADLELRLGLKQPPPSQPATTTPSSELTALAKGQLFFINTFAYPFFETVGKGVPEIEFAAEQIRKNKAVWDQTLSNVNGGV